MKLALTILAAVLAIAAAPPYIRDILRHKTKPERMSWFILSLLGLIAFISQWQLGASWSLVFSGLDTAASLLVFCLSWRFGVGGYTKFDISALCIAGIGIVMAIASDQPVISLLGVILADAAGVVLTVRKAYLDPSSETTISWVLFGTAAILGAITVGEWSWTLLLYPVYLVVANYAVPVAQEAGRFRNSAISHRTKTDDGSATLT